MSGSPLIYYILLHENHLSSPGMLARSIDEAVNKHGFRMIMSGDCRHVWRILNNPNVFLADSVPHGWWIS
jgi:hypothetical protein